MAGRRERGRSEEVKEEEPGRPAGTVTALTPSDLVPSLSLGGRGGDKFKCDDRERSPGAVSRCCRHPCRARNTRSPGEETPPFCRRGCVMDFATGRSAILHLARPGPVGRALLLFHSVT